MLVYRQVGPGQAIIHGSDLHFDQHRHTTRPNGPDIPRHLLQRVSGYDVSAWSTPDGISHPDPLDAGSPGCEPSDSLDFPSLTMGAGQGASGPAYVCHRVSPRCAAVRHASTTWPERPCATLARCAGWHRLDAVVSVGMVRSGIAVGGGGDTTGSADAAHSGGSIQGAGMSYARPAEPGSPHPAGGPSVRDVHGAGAGRAPAADSWAFPCLARWRFPHAVATDS